MLLNKLESGLLLFQTQQGVVAVEPSFWQRVYLLWTFRNFRQLSLPLLNSRQIALVNDLFRHHAAVSHEYEPSLEIGRIENFVPPAIGTGAELATITGASPVVDAMLPERTRWEYDAPPEIPFAADPVVECDVPPALENEQAAEGALMNHAEIPPGNALRRLVAPILSWPIISSLTSASSNLRASQPDASRPPMSKFVIFRFAAAIGALSLCIYFIVAFQRVGAAPHSQAHSAPRPLNSPDSPPAPAPVPVAETPATEPDGPPQAEAAPVAAVEPELPKTPSPSTTARRNTKSERASRGATPRFASRPGVGSHAGEFSRAPLPASARRQILARPSREATARSAQRYFQLARQQMREGNYGAAEANYRKAWRIEQRSAAARGRMMRARRAMQARNESFPNPR